jgi:hypothetical protein
MPPLRSILKNLKLASQRDYVHPTFIAALLKISIGGKNPGPLTCIK